jgi:hypothetical protein
MHERLHRFRERHYAAQEHEAFSKKTDPQEVDSCTFHVFIVPQVLVLGPCQTITYHLNEMKKEDIFASSCVN